MTHIGSYHYACKLGVYWKSPSPCIEQGICFYLFVSYVIQGVNFGLRVIKRVLRA